MSETPEKYIDVRLEVHSFIDEDYDENDAPIGRAVIDGITVVSVSGNLTDDQLSQLSGYVQHTRAAQYTLTEELPIFIRKQVKGV